MNRSGAFRTGIRSSLAALTLVGGIGASVLLGRAEAQNRPLAAPVDARSIAEGKYLATAGDCIACHTAPGGAPFAGGAVIQTPFGQILGPNITPDKKTGIGNMTDQQFVDAVKYGIGHQGRLYPAMPYVYFNKVPSGEILKIRAYLNTLPPVHYKVISNRLPFPYGIRPLVRGWRLLFFSGNGDYRQDPSQSAEWNRGAYLVQGLGHCAACHTPKNALGADKTGKELQGEVLAGWNAPNITGAWNGVGVWSVQDIAAYLKTGHNQYAYASGPMADVVFHSTSYLTDADLAAIAVYLKALPGQGGAAPQPLAAEAPVMREGAKIYRDECSACHTESGSGQAGLFPAFTRNPAILAENPVTLVRVTLQGAQGVGTTASPTAPSMPAFAGLMSNRQIAAVLTYIRNSWGNAAPAVRADAVSRARNSLPGR